MVYVDTLTGFVYNDEVLIGHLNQNELAIIKCLVEREGEAVSREALLAVGWPGRIVVQNSVNMAIKNIRNILLKVSNEAFIVTLPREGYRIIPGTVLIRGGESCETVTLDVEYSRFLHVPFVKWLRSLDINSTSWSFVFFFIFSIMLWWAVFTLYSGRESLQCMSKKDVVVCSLERGSVSQAVLDNAPQEPGTYIYGVDPVTRRGVYEKKN